MKIIKPFIVLLFLFFHGKSIAQVSINTTGAVAATNAILDVSSTTKGILIPRMNTADRILITGSQGLTVFDVNTNSFWFHNGSVWVNMLNANNGWALKGNANTNPLSNFVGTTDNVPLVFRVENSYAGQIGSNGIVALGRGAAAVLSDASIVAIGKEALLTNGTGATGAEGKYNTAVGSEAMKGNTIGHTNTAVGFNVLKSNVDGKSNTAVGANTMLSNIDGTSNTAVGEAALFLNNSGMENTAIGEGSLYSNTKGSNNTANGFKSLASNDLGYENTAIGNFAMRYNKGGYNNTATGSNALRDNIDGRSNTASGERSLLQNKSGDNNSAVGTYSMNDNLTGDYNTGIGYSSLFSNKSGYGNTAVGANADVNGTDLTNATAIGYFARAENPNSMSFGNSFVTGWAFGRYSVAAGNAIQVGDNSTDGNGASLTSGGVWTNASDSTKKEDKSALKGSEILSKIMQLPISQWKYKGTNEYHIGPMAQDFYKLFNVGSNNLNISSIDPAGIALKGIQELQQEILDLIAQNKFMISQINTMKKMISKSRE
jgi:trimeric autotransporter adhesin